VARSRAYREQQRAAFRASQQAQLNGARQAAHRAGYKPPPKKKPVVPLPPAGSYNPDLDAARAAASRGILDTRQDTELGLSRAGQDYTFGVEDLNRGLQDHTDAFHRNTEALQRSFNILAGRQQEQANGQLLGGGGGALLQAAAKRKENQGIQQQGLNEDQLRAVRDTNIGIGRLGVGYTRQTKDAVRDLGRAERENTAYGLDLDAQRYFQAAQSGWEPPKPQAHPTSPHPTTRQRHRRGLVGTVGPMKYGVRF
jgi:hypothetical protein